MSLRFTGESALQTWLMRWGRLVLCSNFHCHWKVVELCAHKLRSAVEGLRLRTTVPAKMSTLARPLHNEVCRPRKPLYWSISTRCSLPLHSEVCKAMIFQGLVDIYGSTVSFARQLFDLPFPAIKTTLARWMAPFTPERDKWSFLINLLLKHPGKTNEYCDFFKLEATSIFGNPSSWSWEVSGGPRKPIRDEF